MVQTLVEGQERCLLILGSLGAKMSKLQQWANHALPCNAIFHYLIYVSICHFTNIHFYGLVWKHVYVGEEGEIPACFVHYRLHVIVAGDVVYCTAKPLAS